jgi:hypothetical protein
LKGYGSGREGEREGHNTMRMRKREKGCIYKKEEERERRKKR